VKSQASQHFGESCQATEGGVTEPGLQAGSPPFISLLAQRKRGQGDGHGLRLVRGQSRGELGRVRKVVTVPDG
jgi:hypothetical protein